MFCQHVKKNKCFVPLQKLTEDVICSFQPRSKSPEINPYSSIEEVFSSSDKNNTSSEESVVDSKPKYNMRARIIKCEHYSTKSLWENHSDINYADWISTKDDPPTPKRKKPIIKVKKEPSSSRIAAQQEIIKKKAPKLSVGKTVSNSVDVPKPKPKPKKFFWKNPRRMIPVHRCTYSTRSKPSETEDDPALDTTTTPPSDTTPKVSPPTLPKPKPKGKLVTTDHTLQRFKKECYFRCLVCLIHKTTTFKLNKHYKRRHPLSSVNIAL